MKELNGIGLLLPFAMIAAAIAACILGSRAIISIYRRSLRKTMVLPSAINSQEDLITSTATAQSLLSKEFEGRPSGGDDWVRFPVKQRARGLRVYLVCGALMTLILCVALLMAYPWIRLLLVCL